MQKEKWNIVGIDYGSKLAGTTVIAGLTEGKIQLDSSEKKKDADAFILEWVEKSKPQFIFIDAPLSLPGVYTQLPNCQNYFYRKGDSELGAMSPMFLGGLTARAMKLKKQLEAENIKVLEVYPGQMAKKLFLKEIGYKKQLNYLPAVLEKLLPLLEEFDWEAQSVNSWHHLDALLALLSGIRYMKNIHNVFGDKEEGVIIV